VVHAERGAKDEFAGRLDVTGFNRRLIYQP
jgi:hypothetical protein